MTESQFVKANNYPVDAFAFHKALIVWGQEHFRSFPWRLTKNPYHILMAEVMLHRTQAPQVVPIYNQFIEYYPDISKLAQASEEDLHNMLYSLGLHWRINLIHKMAAELMVQFGGQIPQKKVELLSLSGVSEYIASAVCCFAWDQPEPLIDTNTVRVMGRLFGLEIKDSSRRNRRFRELITALVDQNEPSVYHYALLDLADQICTKKHSPACFKCPVQKYCVYGTGVLAGSFNNQIGETGD